MLTFEQRVVVESFMGGDNHVVTALAGSGKTTLCRLLARFYDVSGGRITIGGHDLKETRLDHLKSYDDGRTQA